MKDDLQSSTANNFLGLPSPLYISRSFNINCMSEIEITGEVHEKLARSLFNATWDLLEKGDRTHEDDVDMIHAAHASRHHWGRIGGPLQFGRGEWQISRVYSVLGRGEPALYHAKLCLDTCQENDIGDFDLAFAYEAMARAHAVSRNEEDYEKYRELAEKAGEEIEDKGNKDYFMGELSSIQF